MIYKEHVIELFVNGELMDLESQKSLNLRFNDVLYNPEKIASTQAEYSFEFELPSTPNNDKVFDYANNLSKLNKFNQRFNAEVYADGTIIFKGSLTLNGFKDKKYSCNLVSVKVYSLDDIFGDSTMNEIPWEIEFDGAGTTGKSINYYNALSNTNVVFPLVSYGAFQKSPKKKGVSDYTSKFDLDKYNRWYVESFYPSLSLLETIRKAFEYKNYVVAGDAFEDAYLKDIFMSTNLADGQSPDYNIGNPKFGKVDLSISWTAPDREGVRYGTNQDLKFKRLKSGMEYWIDGVRYDPDYNWKEIVLYDMLDSREGGAVTEHSSSYMYQPNEHIIVIPADGFYKIDMSITARLVTNTTMTASQWVHEWQVIFPSGGRMNPVVEEKDITFTPNFSTTTPLEIQLVRNYDNNIELIKGKYNYEIGDGYPDHTTICNKGQSSNYAEGLGCYPHEPVGRHAHYWCELADLEEETFGPNATYSNATIGDMPGNSMDIMAYDPAVSPAFICGFSSMGDRTTGGTASVIKNGYSWSKTYSEKIQSFYRQNGYYAYNWIDYWHNPDAGYTMKRTDINKNKYPQSPATTFSRGRSDMYGNVSCMVYLNKNDVLQLFAVHREYHKESNGFPVPYTTTATVNLKITAASPRSYEELDAANYGYNTPTEFPVNLQLGNFLNKEKKISEWMQNAFDAFNLEVVQDGKSVFVNKRRKLGANMNYAIDVDDRVNTIEAESSAINYPKSMAVRYKIDTDEWGFEKSVYPPEKMNYPDWKDYGDSGFTVIQLNDDSYETSKSEKNLQFSYTWYDNFKWYPVDSSYEQSEASPIALPIPVISKFTYMIDGYNYEESMKHDGYSLPQRFWFRPKQTSSYVWTRTYPAERVNLYLPVNVKDNLNLSYKTNENSLLLNYFNITPYLASNYVIIDAYLTADEYKMIKNGSMIKFDSDLYIPVEISGFDPSGNNTTEIKMMKKVT